jgi:hypothetical protein
MSNETALKLLKQSLMVGDKTALIREAIRELEELEPETSPGLFQTESSIDLDMKIKALQNRWIGYAASATHHILQQKCNYYSYGYCRNVNKTCEFKTCPQRGEYISSARIYFKYPDLFKESDFF